MNEKNKCYKCMVCGKYYPIKNLIPMGTVRKAITEAISQDFPEWSPQSYICQADCKRPLNPTFLICSISR